MASFEESKAVRRRKLFQGLRNLDNLLKSNTNTNEASTSEDYNGDSSEANIINSSRENISMPTNKEETLMEDDFIKITFQKRLSKRRDRFHLFNNYFDVRFTPKNNEQILTQSVVDLVEIVLLKIISIVQDMYDKSERRLMFVTLCDKKIHGGLRSGAFKFQESPEVITNIMIYMLENLIQSNLDLTLSKDFKIIIRILNEEHVRERHLRGLSTAGLFGIPPLRRKHKLETYLRVIHPGYQKNPRAFENKCLVAGCIVGFAQYLMDSKFDTKSNQSVLSEKEVKLICEDSLGEGGEIIMNQMIHFLEENSFNELELMDPKLVLPAMEKFYGCQYIILKRHQGYIRKSYASTDKFVLFKPVVYMKDEQTINQPISHVNVIKNLEAFFVDNYGDFYCVYCDKKSNLRDRHVCCRPDMCNSCWKPSLTDLVKVSRNDEFIFCKAEEGFSYICPKCNRTCVSQKCILDHKDQCRKRWKCPKCNKVESPTKGISTLEAMANKHNCLFKKCYICKERYIMGNEHECKMLNEFGQKTWPKMILAVQEENSISIWREEIYHETFAYYNLTTNSESSAEYFIEKYLPEEMGQVKLGGLSRRFNVHRIDFETEIDWDDSNILHVFIRKFLTLKTYENSVILFWSKADTYSLNPMLLECLNLGIKLTHQRKKSQVISICFSQPGVKVLDITNYLSCDINTQDCKALFSLLITFVRETFDFQCRLFDSLTTEEKIKFEDKTFESMPYMHCFGQNLMTITNFFYKTFKFYFYLYDDLLAMVNEDGIYSRSSNEEILFIQYEMYKRRNDRFTYYSSLDEKNQKNLDGIFPDLYVEETQEAFFFHGKLTANLIFT